MKYFFLKSFNSEIDFFHHFSFKLNDPDDNSWLINYGIDLESDRNYFNIEFYGDENLLNKQSIIQIKDFFIVNQNLIDYFKQIIDFKFVDLLDFEFYKGDSKNKILHNFKIINFKNSVSCINWKFSRFDMHDEDKKRCVFYKVMVTPKIKKHLFGCVDKQRGIFVNEQIKEQLEKKQFISLAFEELIIE